MELHGVTPTHKGKDPFPRDSGGTTWEEPFRQLRGFKSEELRADLAQKLGFHVCRLQISDVRRVGVGGPGTPSKGAHL